MTQFSDGLKQGQAYFARAGNWQPNNQWIGNLATGTFTVNETEVHGIPHSQTITYEIGTASTSLASGIFFSTATQPGGTLTCTGALVTASVATLDVPRAIKITASTDNSTSVFTIIGTDGYGQTIAVKMIGPTGNTLGTNGSFKISPAAFKTITFASMVGSSTGGLQIGTADYFGLDYRIANVGKVLNINVNGLPATVATGAGFYASTAPSAFDVSGVSAFSPIVAGFAATGTHTASSADVRGMVSLPTSNLADGSKRVTVHFIAPTVGTPQLSDTKENSYGLTPATG